MLRLLVIALVVPLLGCHAIWPLDTRPPAGPEASALDASTSDAPTPDAPTPDAPTPDAPADLSTSEVPRSDFPPFPDIPSGPSTGTLSCWGAYVMSSFSKVCINDTDCAAVMRQVDCCGTHEALGINASQEVQFNLEAVQCASTYPPCACPTLATTADDGSKSYSWTNDFGAACVNGVCTSYVGECGQPCLGGLECRVCAITPGSYYGACSTSCTSDADCPPPQPHCSPKGWPSTFCAAVAPGCM